MSKDSSCDSTSACLGASTGTPGFTQRCGYFRYSQSILPVTVRVTFHHELEA